MPMPSSYRWSEYDLSSEASGRNLAGEMLKDLVSRKDKIELEWPPLKPADAATLLTACSAAVYLSITYPSPKTGTEVTKTMYVGDRDGELLKYSLVEGVQYWDGIKFNFIEK